MLLSRHSHTYLARSIEPFYSTLKSDRKLIKSVCWIDRQGKLQGRVNSSERPKSPGLLSRSIAAIKEIESSADWKQALYGALTHMTWSQWDGEARNSDGGKMDEDRWEWVFRCQNRVKLGFENGPVYCSMFALSFKLGGNWDQRVPDMTRKKRRTTVQFSIGIELGTDYQFDSDVQKRLWGQQTQILSKNLQIGVLISLTFVSLLPPCNSAHLLFVYRFYLAFCFYDLLFSVGATLYKLSVLLFSNLVTGNWVPRRSWKRSHTNSLNSFWCFYTRIYGTARRQNIV